MNENGITSTTAVRGTRILVVFKGHRRAVYNNPLEYPFKVGDLVIVEAERGEDAGYVKSIVLPLPDISMQPQFSVIRRGNSEDLKKLEQYRQKEQDVLNLCKEKILNHQILMELVDAEYRFDGQKLTIFFAADGRIDFRELVKDLAGTFRIRIELRQIGARDEMRRGDGYGVCGCRLCCVNFLENFKPITTQMAKVQGLILNPAKLSGVCGKLKCCMAFEADNYPELQSSEILSTSIEIPEIEESIENLSD